MQDLVNKCSKRSGLVIDLISGTFAIAKSYLELPLRFHFVGCKVDVECFAVSTQPLAGTYARKVLNEISDSLGTNEVAHACMVVV